jgi:hypothetical protein
MKLLRTCFALAVLATTLAAPFNLPTTAQAQVQPGGFFARYQDIYTVAMYAAAPGGQYSYYTTVFITHTVDQRQGIDSWDRSQQWNVGNALTQAGYVWYGAPEVFWRRSTNF